MLVDRYPPADLFALVPELAAAFGPELRELARLLDAMTRSSNASRPTWRGAPRTARTA